MRILLGLAVLLAVAMSGVALGVTLTRSVQLRGPVTVTPACTGSVYECIGGSAYAQTPK